MYIKLSLKTKTMPPYADDVMFWMGGLFVGVGSCFGSHLDSTFDQAFLFKQHPFQSLRRLMLLLRKLALHSPVLPRVSSSQTLGQHVSTFAFLRKLKLLMVKHDSPSPRSYTVVLPLL